MALPPIESALKLGFRFEPKPADAVTYYLPRLIAGVSMHATIAPFVHGTDVYTCEPGVLAAQFRPTPSAGDRFFFTTCKRQPQKSGKTSRGVRAAGAGHWHSQGHTTDVLDDEGVKVGEARKFRYKKGGAFTDWLMDEFSSCAADTVVGDRQYVLCKMYVSPRAGPDSAARQESAAFVAFAPSPPAPEKQEPVVAAPNNNNKRPAPPVAEPPRPAKRIRSAAKIPTPPPVVQPPLPSPVQAPASHQRARAQPSIQTSTMAPAPCSPVAARDPFCTETEPPAAAAQEDGGLDFEFDIDVDLAKSLEGSLWMEQADEAPAEAQDDDDSDFHFAKSLESSLVLETEKQAEEEAPAEEADDDTDWLPSFKPAKELVHKEIDPPFDPTIGRKPKSMMSAL